MSTWTTTTSTTMTRRSTRTTRRRRTTRKTTTTEKAARGPSKPTRSALADLARRDERLGAWLGRIAPYPGFPDRKNPRQRSHWDALASAIVYQQLHGKAA